MSYREMTITNHSYHIHNDFNVCYTISTWMTAFLAPIAILCNATILYVVKKSPVLQTKCIILVANLAVADLLLGVQYTSWAWRNTFGPFCMSNITCWWAEGLWFILTLQAVRLSNLLLSIDRLIAVWFYDYYRTKFGMGYVFFMCFSSWVIIATVAVYFTYVEYLMLPFVVTTCILINIIDHKFVSAMNLLTTVVNVVNYGLVIGKVIRQFQKYDINTTGLTSFKTSIEYRTLRVLIVVAMVTILFSFSSCAVLNTALKYPEDLRSHILPILYLIWTINSSLNLFIHSAGDTKFRKCLIKAFAKRKIKVGVAQPVVRF